MITTFPQVTDEYHVDEFKGWLVLPTLYNNLLLLFI